MNISQFSGMAHCSHCFSFIKTYNIKNSVTFLDSKSALERITSVDILPKSDHVSLLIKETVNKFSSKGLLD